VKNTRAQLSGLRLSVSCIDFTNFPCSE
jgi:hypothetical protein